MGDQVFAHHPAQGVLQLHGLNEEIVLRVQLFGAHRRFEIEAEPFLDATHAGALGEIEEKREVEHDGRGKNRIAAEKIDFDLHGIAEPAEDIDVVPAFFIVTARRIVIDADLVVNLAVEIRIEAWAAEYIRERRAWILPWS